MKRFFFLFSISCLLIACPAGGDDNPPIDAFDRQLMLSNWADHLIIPAFAEFAVKTNELKIASEAFTNNPSSEVLVDLRQAWEAAYLLLQQVSMYEIGKAEELSFYENLNLYPTDVMGIEENVTEGGYNLDLPSQRTRQGFPALDYLLYGLRSEDADLIALYENDARYGNYLVALVSKINSIANEISEDWETNFRSTFIANNGNSATASTDVLVNDYLFFYERYLRAGKVGIPAGVFSSGGNTLPENVEAFYKKDLSKQLLLEALTAVQNFFNGQAFENTTTGPSLASYLNELGSTKGGKPLAQVINEQFETARDQINTLDDNFVMQISNDNAALLGVYDQLQLNVVNLKVDMLQALNITVDFIDADGD